MKGNGDANLKSVFILGAGSSISHNDAFPSIRDFFSKATKLGIPVQNELSEYIRKKNFSRGSTFGTRKIDIESVLTNLEIDLERFNDPKLHLTRDQILKLIQLVLIKVQPMNESQNSLLYQFIKKLNQNDSIITFNWDILLDNLLGREAALEWAYNNGAPTENWYWNFVFKLSAHGENTIDGSTMPPPYSEWPKAQGYFLKMHGSIDWAYCNNELCRHFGKGFIIDKIGESLYCSSCHESTHSLLIPPVLNKQYRKYHLIRRVWNTALREIEIAERIIIWGYSLPETDFYSSWLLRNGTNVKKLILINPDVLKGKKEKKINKKFVNRFSMLFQNTVKKTDIDLYETFDDYLAERDIYEKYGIAARYGQKSGSTK